MSLHKNIGKIENKPRSLSKESVSLRNLKIGNKVNETSTVFAFQNQTKSFLKSNILKKNPTEATLHKRTISDSSVKLLPDNAFLVYSSALCNKLRQKLCKTQKPEEKIMILLEFMENLGKINANFSEVFDIISQTIKDYQKYIKSLDSTRTENNENNLEIQNSIFSKELCKKINYKKSKRFQASAETSIIKEKIVEPIKLPVHKKKKSLLFMSIPTEYEEPDIPLHKTVKNVNKALNIPAIHLSEINSKAYQEEFMEKFDEFSDSWKAGILKLNN